MRKLNKNNTLATTYKKWHDELKNKKHPKYNSSNFRFYHDIIANLIWIQEGLCAYTEKMLQNPTDFSPGKWKNGGFPTKFKFAGQLDHYDDNLKAKYGWRWSNFFVIDSDINMKEKHSITPNGILKPDLLNFNSIDFIEYDFKLHIFSPSKAHDFDTQEEILHDINCLGLNFPPIVDLRKSYLNPIINRVKYNKQTINEAENEIYQFYTAFELCKPHMI